jgi:hypothetical protein
LLFLKKGDVGRQFRNFIIFYRSTTNVGTAEVRKLRGVGQVKTAVNR